MYFISEGFYLEIPQVVKDLKKEERNGKLKSNDFTDQKDLIYKKYDSEKRFQDIAYLSVDWIWEVDKDGRYTYTSERVKDHLGYEPAELIGKTPFDLMPKDEAKRVGEIFKNIVANKEKIVDLENWNLSKNGERVCLLTNGIPLIDDNGNLIGYRGVDKDITKSKINEIKIRESEKKYRSIFENVNDEIIILDNSGVIIDVNPRIKDILGYNPDEFIGKQFFKLGFLKINKIPEMMKVFWDIVKKKKSVNQVHWELEHKDGHTVHIEVSVRPLIVDGKTKEILCIIREATEHIKSEMNLSYQKEKAEKYLNLAGTILVSLDANGNITLLNKKGYEILGYDEGELIGKNWFDTCISKDIVSEVKDVFKNLIKGDIEPIKNFENQVIRKDGETRIVYWYNTILKNKEGKIEGILSSGEDITEKRKVEKELKESEKFLSEVFNSITDGLSVLDKDLNVIITNRYMEKMYINNMPLIGKKCYQVYQNRTSHCPWCPSLKAMEMKTTQTNIVAYPNNEEPEGWLNLSAYPLIDKNGEVNGIIEYVKDITEQKKAEKELKEKLIELENFHNFAVGREIKMVELKKEINNLYEKFGEKPKYDIVE